MTNGVNQQCEYLSIGVGDDRGGNEDAHNAPGVGTGRIALVSDLGVGGVIHSDFVSS